MNGADSTQSTTMVSIKHAQTQYPVADLIRKRWSARAFSPRAFTQLEINTILEAANWAPSAMNEQPWRYIVALKQNEEGFQQLLSYLNPGNAAWAQHAAALVFSYAKTTYTRNQQPNINALHDTGMANQNLLLQAISMNIYSHVMEGFDKRKISTDFNLAEDEQAVVMIALGHLGDAAVLDEPFRSREATPRSRKELGEFVKEL